MVNDDITSRLVGQNVTVNCVKVYGEKISREGKIDSVNPRIYLVLDYGGYSGVNIFVGIPEAIHTIVADNGKILYQNDAILNAYDKDCIDNQATRDQLRSQGVFFPDN